MKREIKFRAWFPEHKEMHEWQKFDGAIIKNIFEQPDFCILQQFTGLKDKNGVEIYEGDVLQNPQGKKGFIKFEDCGFVLESKRDETTIWTTTIDKGFLKNKTVIGNIHENPELL